MALIVTFMHHFKGENKYISDFYIILFLINNYLLQKLPLKIKLVYLKYLIIITIIKVNNIFNLKIIDFIRV